MKTNIPATCVSVLLFLCGLSLQAQTLQSVPVTLKNDLRHQRSFSQVQAGLSKTAACGPDTVNYTYYKTSQFQAVSLNNVTSGNAFAQWYPAPQPITLSGFEFYAWQSSGTSAVVSITCNVYYSTADSLPTGSPLRSVTVNVDSTFQNGTLSALLKSAVFTSPITLNTPYVITVETSSSTSVSIVTNNYNSSVPDGRSQWLSSVRIASNYLRSYSINVGGIPFNADFILQPYVSYNITPNFTFTGCNQGGNTINFTNTSSPVLFSPFYNLYAFYNIAYLGCIWDYGDSTGTYYAQNGSHAYTYRAPHTVKLKDTMYGWTRGCVDVVSKVVYATPDAPVVSNDGPHCSGDTLKLISDSIPGATYQWTGPGGYTSPRCKPVIPNSTTSHTGSYQAKATLNGCTSAGSGTSATIYAKPQKPVATNNGPKCLGDSVTFTANSPSPNITYYWSGPGGFTSTQAQFGIGNVDTLLSGDYIVFVNDPNCSSVPDTTTLLVYPPPVAPSLAALGKDTLCEGDTLKLQGNSVVGAQFFWSGPSGFSSGSTNPVVNGVTTGHTGYYKAFVKVGSCSSQPDSVAIFINSLPVTSAVSGSDTSTESLVKIYSVTGSPGSTFSWTITGGTIQSGNGTNSVTVLWGTPGAGKLTVTETNTGGCSGIAKQLNVTITQKPNPQSIEEFAGKGLMRVYPNPANGQVYLLLELNQPEKLQYRLADMLGRELLTGNAQASVQHKESLDISALPAGVYLFTVSLGDQQRTVRLVVR